MASNHQSLSHSVMLMGQSRNDPLTASQMAIFDNIGRRVCICDFTELLVRAIIWDVRREMEEKMKREKNSVVGGGGSDGKDRVAPPPFPALAHGVSIKRSLQKFLQRRRDRIRSASPYNH
ncbi:protein TIFY 5B-like isoform X7 [Diospyros lotus]|uniref:protein TIFY 5B-like isoform X7 n=1 Tax=Diospyros lotus TaxID=55363 RepID=UPI0022569D88|nr:protein TIFY 5B-like isoform X7 [Diospyros lotus]